MLNDQTLQTLNALAIAMKEYARGGAGGARRAKALGSSAEFSDFREYAPGDDVRRIDWNAYARFDRLFLKLFMEEREMCLTLLLDASASMDFGAPTKWQFACELAEALSYLALRGGDKVSLIALTGDGIRRSDVLSGHASFLKVSQFLAAVEPGGAVALDALVPKVLLDASRGVAILISDLLCTGEGENALASLAYRKQQVALLHLLSAEELAPALEGALRLIDAEQPASSIDLTMSRETLLAYERTLTDFQKRARARCHRLGAGYAQLRSDQDLMAAITGQLADIGVIQG